MKELQEKFIEEARKWADAKVKYRHRGTTKRGCDCTGLVIGIMRSLGYIKKYELRMYPRDWNLHSGAGNYIIEEITKISDEIPNNDIDNGDLVVFRFGKCIAHIGVMVDMSSRLFVHSLFSAKCCKYSILKNSMWSKRWIKSYRLNNEKMALYS